ncbi:fungal pheromone mating factor STE2 GPCR-domain-containing protein [Xylogone sp. PMI_703]|nr:fungal pheromone mating factor STE2 GPCR-domain-containing protein [Xylogone sp. PMI_703]
MPLVSRDQLSIENSKFSPFTQNLTILLGDGVSQFNFTIQDLDGYNYYNTASCISFGAQAGASLAMLVIILVLSSEKRKKTPIFIFNVLSLVLSFLNSLLLALYFVGPWSEVWTQFALDFTYVPTSAYATTVTSNVIAALLTVTVNTSLTLQAYTVCQNYQKRYKYIIISMAVLVLFSSVGFHFAQMVVLSYNTVRVTSSVGLEWIQTGSHSTETVSIWYFSMIFTVKLLYVLWERKQRGWKQWSAVRVLVLMSGCTMIIPSIFAILEYVAVDSFPEAGSLALTIVALLLPLSSLWAAMANDADVSLNLSQLSQARSQLSASAAKPPTRGIFLSGSPNGTLITAVETRMDEIASSPAQAGRRPSAPRDSTELDLEAMGVRVDSSYSVHSSKALASPYR